MGVDLGIVKRSGAWYEYSGEKLGQGKEAAKATLRENEKMAKEIELKIRQAAQQTHDLPLQVGGEDETAAKEK